jgi:hypothetical protein
VTDDEVAYVPTDAELRSILREAETIAVVGLSSNPERPSNEVAAYLRSKGYRIVPVNPNETEVFGERAYPSLLDVPEEIRIDVVDVFRRAEHTPEIAEQAVARRAKVLWLQEGIANDDARRIGEEAGLTVVMGVCIKKQQQRLEGVRGRSRAGGERNPREQGGFGGVVEPEASEAPESKGGSGA